MDEETPRRKLMFIGHLLAGLAAFAGITTLIVTAIQKIYSGRGLETFYSVWLGKFNWIGFLVLVAAVVVAIFISLGLLFWEKRQDRLLEKKHRSRKNNI
ncbi:MAG: hypothetical protein WBQ05_03495 [Candidatus Competibacter denitrificans]